MVKRTEPLDRLILGQVAERLFPGRVIRCSQASIMLRITFVSQKPAKHVSKSAAPSTFR